MAKVSMVERDKKRRRLAAQYAKRRAALRAAVRDASLAPDERFAASLKLAAMPRNGAQGAVAQSLRSVRAAARLLPQIPSVANRTSRIGVAGAGARRRQGELVGKEAAIPCR